MRRLQQQALPLHYFIFPLLLTGSTSSVTSNIHRMLLAVFPGVIDCSAHVASRMLQFGGTHCQISPVRRHFVIRSRWHAGECAGDPVTVFPPLKDSNEKFQTCWNYFCLNGSSGSKASEAQVLQNIVLKRSKATKCSRVFDLVKEVHRFSNYWYNFKSTKAEAISLLKVKRNNNDVFNMKRKVLKKCLNYYEKRITHGC